MSRKNRRRILFERDPHCHWCGCLTVLLAYPNSAARSWPKNAATVDHLDSRLSPRRNYAGGEERTVLACRECNHRRGAAEEQALGHEELRRRSCRPEPISV